MQKLSCLKPNFNLGLVDKILKLATSWQNRFIPGGIACRQQVE